MLLARVLGSAVCTMKYDDLEGLKLLTVQPLNKKLEPVGSIQVAVDVVQAGQGDLVVLVRSREASLALEKKFVPIDLAIVGIVDELEVKDSSAFDFELKDGRAQYS